jgi:hypothetical protein
MNNSIYYKIARWGDSQIYKYKDTVQVEVVSSQNKTQGIIIPNVNFLLGLYQIMFDLHFTTESVFYINNTGHGAYFKKYLKNGNNKIFINIESQCVLNLFFLIENASIGNIFKISNISIKKVELTNSTELVPLNMKGVYCIKYDKQNSNIGLKIKRINNLFEEYNEKNPCLFVFPISLDKLKGHCGEIFIANHTSDTLNELDNCNIKYSIFNGETLLTLHGRDNPCQTKDLKLEQNNKFVLIKQMTTILTKSEYEDIITLEENQGFDNLVKKISKSKNAKIINFQVDRKTIKLYRVTMCDYKSTTSTISKCYIIENTNDNNYIVKLIPYSNISPLLDINYLFIDTNRYLRDFVMVIFNSTEEISLGNITVEEVLAENMRSSCINQKTKYIDKIEIYLNSKVKKYNVLSIMDEFSSECFSYELNLTHVTKKNINYIVQEDFDFFLCESAWHGYNSDWTGFLVNIDKPTSSVLKKFILNLRIPKIFYGKEDPINFNSFKETAKYFDGDNDLIVTTDCSIVNEYKKLGCKNVTYFPFCCQPIIHHPIGRKDNNNIIFPCSWYGAKYPERCVYMKDMIDMYIKTNKLDIFDRQYLFNKLTMQTDDKVVSTYKGWYCFPDKYVDIIKGQLSYHQVLNSYRDYGIVMNANTITDSNTMFSRRVIEAFACGCSIITNKSTGMEQMFGQAYIEYNTENGKKLMEDTEFRNNMQYIGHIKVMREYTYEKLINVIESIIFSKTPEKVIFLNKMNKKNILIIYLYKGFIKNQSTIKKILKYDVIEHDITQPFFKKKYSHEYTFIMGDWFEYDDNYVENSLIPFSFANIQVSGKACYKHIWNSSVYTIGQECENRFTNCLHPFTTVFTNEASKQILVKNLDGKVQSDKSCNLFNNVILFLRNLSPTLSYSYYKYNFIDYGLFCDDFKINNYSYLNKGKTIEIVKNVVVICNWKRIDRIKKILNNLSIQTNKNFVFCIWNNNKDVSGELIKLLKTTCVQFQTIVYDSPINIGGFGRFLMASYMLNKIKAENIMFFDDDQDIPLTFVEEYEAKITKDTSLNFFGRKFVKGNPYCVIDENNKIVQSLSNNCIQNVQAGDLFDYGGTGGMCVKSFVFNNERLFSIPLKYLFCEDIYLSWVEHTDYKIKIIKSGIAIETIRDKFDQCNTLWVVKNEFLEFLRTQGGWEV